ncbi:tRNA (adenosine(37)-N6)-threonylcarbamoyltransferase complex dimerization subunit type 1 TsaB [Candidatus Peregrinibacteria bacterium]|nr:tRNA (adenosine(37)-N6)-threonylcarbamoyltransferase complex dimerization subunit type 1 TsaB [Candidatus Peregrinibacteria bacterium]
MLTLVINTASFTESVALFTKKKILAEIKWRGAADESEKLLPAILKLLKRAKKNFTDLKRIIVVNGPGPFSAVRIGVTDANILGFALNIPVFSISSEKLWQLRRPEKNAILLLHAGGNFVAVHKSGRETAICKITEIPDPYKLPPLKRDKQATSYKLQATSYKLIFYGDITPDERSELRKKKNLRFIPENKLKTVAETVFNIKLSLLKREKQVSPRYWRAPNITKPLIH